MSALDINKYYCLGFAFYGNNVVLIMKTHPRPQAGLLNAIGGHIEQTDVMADETLGGYAPAVRAMVREFEEETKVKTIGDQWISKGVSVYDNVKRVPGQPDQPYKSHVGVFYTRLDTDQIKQLVSNNALNQEVENQEYLCIYSIYRIKELHEKGLLVRDTFELMKKGLELLSII